MKIIEVSLKDRSYPIWVKPGLLDQIPQLLASYRKRRWVVITQRSVKDMCDGTLIKTLASAGVRASTIVIPEGENAKSLSQVESMYQQLTELDCDRSTLLVAFGGGVVGDITGFLAATYLRGVDYVQVPTTLLAMIDSAIGGKTGVNLPQGKNLVGAFYQPEGVVIDPNLVESLPHREMVSAMAEMLKYGAIRDRNFFDRVSENLDSIVLREDDTMLTEAIARCCEIKAEVVSRDEQEKDLRRILNFGHTIGHALETTMGFGVLKHGEAVAYGMILAGSISRDLGHLSDEDFYHLESAVRKLPLPELGEIDSSSLLETVKRDKKAKGGKLHFVLLQGLGHAIISDQVVDRHIIRALASL
ncbi:MAG: 3-dehydroquinate synthase [Candidatus Neomarinimicrobiota bacterium]